MMYYIVLVIDFFIILFAGSLLHTLIFPDSRDPSMFWIVIEFLIFSATIPYVKKLFKKDKKKDETKK